MVKEPPKTTRNKIWIGDTCITIYELSDGTISVVSNKPFCEKLHKNHKQIWIKNVKYDNEIKRLK